MAKKRCDAEIGQPKTGWHACGRPATVKVWRKSNYSGHQLTLYYCAQHAGRASNREHYTTLAVVSVQER